MFIDIESSSSESWGFPLLFLACSIKHNLCGIKHDHVTYCGELEVDHALSCEIEELRTLPLTLPKGGSKSEFVIFVNKIQVHIKGIKSATKFLCVKPFSGSCSRTVCCPI